MKFLLIAICIVYTSAQRNAWYDECGVKPENRMNEFVVGGEEAEPNEFPWVVTLQFFGSFHYCGGSIITPNWIVTAAHCVFGSPPSSFAIAVGEHSFDEDDDEAVLIDVVNIITHPNYNLFNLNNDIALMELAEPLTFDENVTAICAPDPTDDYLDEIATVAGWGLVDYNTGKGTDVLQYVEVPVISNVECNDLYDLLGYDVTDNMICTLEEGKDACSGDSGGPLWVTDDEGYAVEIGIVSWGVNCGTARFPGVYTRLGNYVDWVCEEIDC